MAVLGVRASLLSVELEDRVKGLIPRHVYQTHGDHPFDLEAGHDVEATRFRKQSEHITQRGILEVQRDFFATIPGPLWYSSALRAWRGSPGHSRAIITS
jgi:hypothetical protein